jgi:putative flippase GtrA
MRWQGLFWKLARAGLVAGIVAAINFFLVWLFAHFLGPRTSFSLAFVSALTIHFLLSKFCTFFNYSPDFSRQVPRYLTAAGVSYLLQFSVFHASLVLFTSNVLVASTVAMPVGMLASFTMLQVWVFSPSRVRTLRENEAVDREGIILSIRKSSPDLAA